MSTQVAATTISQVLAAKLTPDQLAAAQDPASEVLCLACAGSGKSRTLAFRIARLVAEGEDPAGIVAFTFTEKAAESIKQRVAEALADMGLPPAVLGAMYIGTIHAYCQRTLGEMDAKYRQFEVLDENRLKLFLISRFQQLGLRQLQTARLQQRNTRQVQNQATAGPQQSTMYFDTVREVSEAWKIANDELIPLGSISNLDSDLGGALETLNARLDADQYLDFSLMVRRVVEALRSNEPGACRAVSGLRHLMVDEYQDVNPSQEALISELRRNCNTLLVLGDDDQAIYAWRGADVNNPMCKLFQATT